MRAFKHVGKQPLKFVFEAYVADVRGLPNDVSQVAIVWERGGKASTMVTSSTVATQTTGSEERTAMLDETLRMPATLYRSSRRASFDAKPTLIRVLDMSGVPFTTPSTLGTADFELSDHADLNMDSPARTKQLKLPRALLRRGDAKGDMIITLQMTIRSRWIQHEGAEGGGAAKELPERPELPSACAASTASDASSSAASSSLTHAALQALEASHVSSQSGAAEAQLLTHSLVRHGEQRLKGKESSRIAELSQLVSAASADARAAESRLAACQFRLRTEVIDSIEGTLNQAKDIKKVDELAKVYNKQLVLVLDQVGRIASDNGGSISAVGSARGGVSPLEAEVLSLRRELAASKVEVARLNGEKEELDHVARRLNKQLADTARRGRESVAPVQRQA